jgi:cardiolipin synthase
MIQVAIPVHQVRCKIWTDETRDWSIVHEVVLLTLAPSCLTLDALAEALALPRQVIVAALARLMRHRLVEVAASAGWVFFGLSAGGAELMRGGGALPRFPREAARTLRLAVERYSGCCFPSRDVRLYTLADIRRRRDAGGIVKIVEVSEGTASVRHEVTLETLSEIVERGGTRRLLRVDGNTAVLREDQFMLVTVADGVPRLPSSARPALQSIIMQTAASDTLSIGVEAVPSDDIAPQWTPFRTIECDFDPADIILGGTAHGESLRVLLGMAATRLVLHSTFLDHEKFLLLKEAFRGACARGVRVDLLWGAEAEDRETGRNAAAAESIARTVVADPVLRGSMRVRMRTTGSHAKIVVADASDGSWVAVVGSCNWLSSPFQALEASVLLRDPRAVADVISILRETVGRRSIADNLANDLALTANDLRRNAPEARGSAKVTVVFGEAHEAMMRQVSGEATGKLVICTHRVGGNVRPATLLPATLAASRGVEVAVLYTQPNPPMTRQSIRGVAAEAATVGVEFVQAKKVPAHGKMLLWTPHDVLVTSHNWGAASTNLSFPQAEVGVHVRSPGLAELVLARLAEAYPELAKERADGGDQPAH